MTDPRPQGHPDADVLNEARAAGAAPQALYDAAGRRAVTGGSPSPARPWHAPER